MRRTMFITTAAGLLAATASCTSEVGPRPMTATQQSALARTLDNRVAGVEQRCLPSSRTGDMVAAGGQILFRDGSVLYLTRTGGGCEAISSPGSTLVINNGPGQDSLCANRVVTVVSSANGMLMGSCFVEGFIPYRRP